MRRLLLLLGLACLAALPLPLTAQMVEESISRDPGPLDFIQGDSYEQWILQSLAGDALVGLSPTGKVVPRLAATWKAQKNGTLVFTLRSDARYTDGSPVRAEDVVWTFQELLQNSKASPTKRAILEGAQVGMDQGHPWIRSSKPAGRLLMELARVPIAQEAHPERGSGPFAFRKEPGAWVFTRRDHFLKPRIEGIRFRLLPDAAGVMAALQKGWLTIGAPAQRRQTEVPPTHRLVTQPMHAQLVTWSRMGVGALQLLERWRQEAFPPQLLALNARPSKGLWPETLGFDSQEITAGTAPPKGPGVLHLLYPAGDESVEKLLLALRERARKDSFDLQLTPVEQGLLADRLQKGDFQLACSMVVFDPHPWAVLEYLEPQGPMNFTGWKHPRLGALLPRLQQPGDAAWNDLQALWAKAPAALPLLDFQSVIWVDRRLQVEPSPMGLYLHTPGAAGWRWVQ
ncbi:ABC transporter substrate-binding protein [Geothrix sp. PMB-07]|uniref:ABC transporter substrate-binding protein n=1 Tax=Geothrix sp. PMB-07 TaxID=3068640 RepID=UPI00274246B5|nr:ABC transporter substrate-binding protein [Geothrix sp. PMB-07]WLT30594.1 ABC transporter substrate-binding protein [Geothrix sp. PMB-07]